MANTKQSIKRIEINEKKREQNLAMKSELKTVVKKARTAIADNADNKVELQKVTEKTLDQAAAKGIIKKNTAARKKSRIAKAANKAAK